MRVAVTGLGMAVPKRSWSNAEIVERFGLEVDSAWIVSRTGIHQRRWLEDGLATSDLAVEACREALAGAGPGAPDRLILATITPDHPSPSTATIVARKLGVRCMAFDLSAACAGFPYALDLATASVRSGCRRALAVAADVRSRSIDPTDRRSVVLFGDGAAAVVVEPVEDVPPGGAEILATFCSAEGREDMGAFVPAGGTARPTSEVTVREGMHYVRISGRNAIFSDFVALVKESVGEVLDRAGMTLDDVDRFVPHQGNAFLVRDLANALGFPLDRTVCNIGQYGNTAGAALPMGLVSAWNDGRIRPGETVLLASVGAGHAFGAAILRRAAA